MFCVSRTRVRAAARLGAALLPMLALADPARAQASCEMQSTDPACVGGPIASAKALRTAVSQTDGPIAARIRALSGGSAVAGGALFPERHFRVLALGNAGQKLETTDPEIRALEKKYKVDSIPNAIKPRLGLWTDGTWSNLKFNDVGADFDGQIWSGIAGIDYAISDRLTVGLAGSYEQQEYDLSRNQSSVIGSGITAAPYALFKLDNHFSLDATGGYSWLDYHGTWTDPSGTRASASTAANRWFGAGNLSAAFSFDQWRLGGRIGSLYAFEEQDALLSGGRSTNADQALAVGSIRLGYEFSILDGFQPYVSAIGKYAYLDGDSAGRIESRLGAGADLQAGRATLGIRGASVEDREGIRNYTAGLDIRIGF